ncbi:hypothetical protein T06_10465 [Trichinella sp. T6]|nr:hypothetical protein T06_10465 [Trichinella sp. T6]
MQLTSFLLTNNQLNSLQTAPPGSNDNKHKATLAYRHTPTLNHVQYDFCMTISATITSSKSNNHHKSERTKRDCRA